MTKATIIKELLALDGSKGWERINYEIILEHKTKKELLAILEGNKGLR